MRNCSDDEFSPDLWKRVKALFQDLNGKDPALVDARLAAETSQDVAAKVRQLLGFSNPSSDFLEGGIEWLTVRPRQQPQQPSLSLGDTLCNRFRVRAFIGAGGSGEVYEADDLHLGGERLALKILKPRVFDTLAAWPQLAKEVQLARRVTHPNVCRVFDLAKHRDEEGSSFDLVTMELLEGTTLDQLIAAGERLEVDLVRKLSQQLADGLTAAHSVGVLHRDLKPKNIIVSGQVPRSARAVITDFGLARDLLLAESANQESWTSGIFGTPAYMAPEQLCGRGSDMATDIYAFGLVLFEMLTGSKPFQGRTGFEIAAHRLKEEPPPLSRFRPSLNPRWQEAVSACLQPDPVRRPRSLEKVVQLLEPYPKDSVGIAAGTGRRAIPAGSRNRGVGLWATTLKRAAVVCLFVLCLGLLAVISKSTLLDFRQTDMAGNSVRSDGPFEKVGRQERLVVFPFENSTTEPKMDFVAGGLTDEATKALSRLGELEVVSSRSGRLAWEAAHGDPLMAARQLDVGRYVQGTVDQADGQVRVYVEVVDSSTQTVQWTRSFRQPSERVALLVEAVSGPLAAELGSDLDSPYTPPWFEGTTDDYYRYLEASDRFKSRKKDDLEQALQLFDRVIESNPDYVPALVGRANVLNSLAEQGFRSVQETREKALIDASNAVSKDGNNPEALASLGLQLAQDWDSSSEAAQQFEKAIEISPNYAEAHHWYSILLARQGKLPEALMHGEKARQLDSLSTAVNWNLGWLYFNLRDFPKAIKTSNRVLALDPDFAPAYQLKAEAQVFLGSRKAALENIGKARQISQDHPIILSAAAYIEILSGHVGTGLELLGKLLRLNGETRIPGLLIANVYAALGLEEKVFEWLNRAADQRDSVILLARYYPLYDKYRSDPRFKQFLQRFDGLG